MQQKLLKALASKNWSNEGSVIQGGQKEVGSGSYEKSYNN